MKSIASIHNAIHNGIKLAAAKKRKEINSTLAACIQIKRCMYIGTILMAMQSPLLSLSLAPQAQAQSPLRQQESISRSQNDKRILPGNKARNRTYNEVISSIDWNRSRNNGNQSIAASNMSSAPFGSLAGNTAKHKIAKNLDFFSSDLVNPAENNEPQDLERAPTQALGLLFEPVETRKAAKIISIPNKTNNRTSSNITARPNTSKNLSLSSSTSSISNASSNSGSSSNARMNTVSSTNKNINTINGKSLNLIDGDSAVQKSQNSQNSETTYSQNSDIAKNSSENPDFSGNQIPSPEELQKFLNKKWNKKAQSGNADLIKADDNDKHGSAPGEIISEEALQGFIETVGTAEKPELVAMTPSMDNPLDKLKASISESDTKLTASASQATSSASAQQSSLAAAVEQYGTSGVCITSAGLGFWRVTEVLAGAPAAAAGIRSGDKILAIDSLQATGTDMRNAYYRLTGKRGQIKYFTIERQGRRFTLPVRLANIHKINNRRTQYIEYYFFLLYRGYISGQQFNRFIKPFI